MTFHDFPDPRAPWQSFNQFTQGRSPTIFSWVTRGTFNVFTKSVARHHFPEVTRVTFNVFTQGRSLTLLPSGYYGTFNLFTQVASILNLCQPLPDSTRYLQATGIVCLASRDSRTRSETGRMQLGRQSITWSSFWSRSLPGACCTTMWVLARRDWWLSLRCVRHFRIWTWSSLHNICQALNSMVHIELFNSNRFPLFPFSTYLH